MTPFTGSILPAGKARAAPWCWYHKQCATRPAGKSARPAVGRIGAPGALRRLPDALHRPRSPIAHRAYPGDPIRSHEMSQYLLPLVLKVVPVRCQLNPVQAPSRHGARRATDVPIVPLARPNLQVYNNTR